MRVVLVVALGGAAVAIPLLWRRLRRRSNTQVHRINQ
jgi:hypothetical protein